ncbi:protein of unknown function [Oceanospirillum linum]|nr:protein of unknown function [Oleiphilus messinensis]SMP30909.1 protein of unknown function [Oceanospirillum linum]
MTKMPSTKDAEGFIKPIAEEATQQASLFLGESIGFWVQTAAIVLTAFFAAWAVFSARQMTRRKNSADVIFNSKNDKKLRDGIKTISQLHKDSTVELAQFAYDLSNDQTKRDQAASINYVLNYYEYVAVGVKRGIYDEAILKDSSYSTLVHMYEFCQPYIENVRRQNQRPTTWCEFEALAQKWQDKPLKAKRKR